MHICRCQSTAKYKLERSEFDTWLQKLAQEIVQQHTSQALTPENVQATLQLLLAKGDTSMAHSALTESVAKHPKTSP